MMSKTQFEGFEEDFSLNGGPDEIVSDKQLGIRKSNKAGLIIVILSSLVVCGGIGGYYFLNKSKPNLPSYSADALATLPISQEQKPVAIQPDTQDPVAQTLKELEADLAIQPASTVPSLAEQQPEKSTEIKTVASLEPVTPAVIEQAAPPPVVVEKPAAPKPAPKVLAKRKPSPKPKVVSKPAAEEAVPQIIEEPVTSEQILIFSE